MYVLVRLLKGYTQPLTYEVPIQFQSLVRVGSLVLVPLRTQQVTAVVSEIQPTVPATRYEIRAILSVHQSPKDLRFYAFIEKVARFYFVEPATLCARLNSFVFGVDPVEEVAISAAYQHGKEVALTREQQAIVEEVASDIVAARYAPFLIQGVTGSGKTEVYKALIKEAAVHGKTTLFYALKLVLRDTCKVFLNGG